MRNQQFIDVSIKEYAHLYDENNKPKILSGKYALSKAKLPCNTFSYNHTPDSCLNNVEEAKLAITP